MKTPNAAEMAAAIAIERLIVAWAGELDHNDGLAIAVLLAPDCTYTVRGIAREGAEAVVDFYRERLAEIERAGGRVPTQSHAISNVRSRFDALHAASADFLLVYYMSPDAPPVTTLSGPMAVADCRMTFRCDAEGDWRIASFDSTQTFVRAQV